MKFLISSLQFLSYTIFVVFVALLPSSVGVDNRYKTCSSTLFSCGKNISNVGYPFWGDGRPQYCGHPSLQLQCLSSEVGDKTSLKIGEDDDDPYNVENMKLSHLDITLDLQLQPDSPCTSYKKNFSDIFTLSSSVEIITLLYDCKSNISHENNSRDSVSCFSGPGQSLYEAYYLSNKSASGEYAHCRSALVHVFRKELDEYNREHNGLISNVVKRGFEANYEYSSDCLKCKNSSGICGSSNHSGFVCLCKDGPAEFVCRNSGKRKLILAVAIPGGLFILIGLCVGLYCYLRIRVNSQVLLSRMISTDPTISDLETGSSFYGIPVFHYSELQEATNNFDEARELGDGGFGIVYYGRLRDGREVAVKRLYEKSYKQVEQFMNEVVILTRLRHPNLVTLYGCTSRHSRDLLLVYEYISNGTVADHLYGDQSRSGDLTWGIRMKIAVETARALSYLHTSEIVHRDVKTNNILLDSNFCVKVADFGLSRLFPVDVTHVSTAPQGTPGYLDPEYHKCYQVTSKSDVYSFGVVLVELISSLPAVDISRQEDEINLSDYAMNRIQRGVLDELVDQRLGYNSDFEVKREISLVAELAFQCLQQEKEVRPPMTEVLETLMRIEGLDYEALEAEEMDEKRISVAGDDDIQQPPSSPSSVIDNWAIKSNDTSIPSR